MSKSVYLMKRDSDGAHKIGVSNFPKARISGLSCEVGEIVNLICQSDYMEDLDARKAEWKWHKRLAKYAIGREWFILPPRLAKAVSVLIGKSNHPRLNPSWAKIRDRSSRKNYPKYSVNVSKELKIKLHKATEEMKARNPSSLAEYILNQWLDQYAARRDKAKAKKEGAK